MNAPPSEIHELAIRLHRDGRLAEAEELYRRLLALQPDSVEILTQLGNALLEQGRAAAAAEIYRRALAIEESDPDLHNNLANSLQGLRQFEPAIAEYRRALAIQPDDAAACCNLGNALRETGRLDEAVEILERALRLRPDLPEAWNMLAAVRLVRGEPEQAVASLHSALALRPNYPEARNNLGNAHRAAGRMSDAIEAYRKATVDRPSYADAHHNLGVALKETGRLDEAIESHRRAVALQPRYTDAWNSLAGALKDTGRLDEAIQCLRTALSVRPEVSLADNLLIALHYDPHCTVAQLNAEFDRWNRGFARPLATERRPCGNDRSPDRVLRVGYVSPDFHDHPVGNCLLPVLAAHDPANVRIFCYSDVRRPDERTREIRGRAAVWRETRNASDAELAEIIRRDGIDILVDPAAHTRDHRLLTFARRPAPVQVSWLGWPGTTGLETMDWRLTDPRLDPPEAESFGPERILRLPDSFWCYAAQTDEPVGPPPAERGFVTFGCLNNFCKINPPLLDAWGRILSGISGSRLLLRAPPGSARSRVAEQLHRHGVGADRIEFIDRVPHEQYWRLYHRMDVALDTLPYGGHTTSMDALWMGVPVVSIVGRLPVGRAGRSILFHLNRTDLVADGVEQYVRIARELAGDLDRLRELRTALRPRMQASPMTDGPRFARNLEAALRSMWREWCARPTNPPI